jgi:acyl dehydratase
MLAGHGWLVTAGWSRLAGHGWLVTAGWPRLAGHGWLVTAGWPRLAGHGWLVTAGWPRLVIRWYYIKCLIIWYLHSKALGFYDPCLCKSLITRILTHHHLKTIENT